MESKKLWTICKTFKKLPNDPLILSMGELQKDWIMANLAKEGRESQDNLNRSLGKGGMSMSSAADVPEDVGHILGIDTQQGK